MTRSVELKIEKLDAKKNDSFEAPKMLQNRPEFVHPFGNGDSKCLKTDRNVRKKTK